jgi:hypothetical protein
MVASWHELYAANKANAVCTCHVARATYVHGFDEWLIAVPTAQLYAGGV